MKELNNKGLKLIQNVIKDPFYSLSYLMGNIAPSYFRKRYVKKTKLSGLNDKFFIHDFNFIFNNGFPYLKIHFLASNAF